MGKKDSHKAQKKDIVTQRQKKESKGLVAGLAVAALAVALTAVFVFTGGDGFKAVSAEAGLVRLPVSEVNDGHAHFYTYDTGAKKINFFVLRSSDGVIRAAFDACDVCFGEKKGYRQEGDIMVCNNCGQRFPSIKINEIKGGCNPAPLARGVEGGYLMLRSADIEQGGYYF